MRRCSSELLPSTRRLILLPPSAAMMLPWQCALVGRAATHVAHSQASPVMTDALGSVNHRAQRCPAAGRTVASKAKLPPKRSCDYARPRSPSRRAPVEVLGISVEVGLAHRQRDPVVESRTADRVPARPSNHVGELARREAARPCCTAAHSTGPRAPPSNFCSPFFHGRTEAHNGGDR